MREEGRRRAGAEQRLALLERYHKSGETQRAFCAGEKVSVSTLQSWLKRERAVARFAEVVPARSASTTVELVFPDGTALRIRSA